MRVSGLNVLTVMKDCRKNILCELAWARTRRAGVAVLETDFKDDVLTGYNKPRHSAYPSQSTLPNL